MGSDGSEGWLLRQGPSFQQGAVLAEDVFLGDGLHARGHANVAQRPLIYKIAASDILMGTPNI